jgi:LuxR family maltose regulon positive regulatory protein
VTKPNIHRVAGPLLAAKCTIPAARPNAVIRHRLHEWLLGNAATRLTVVVAPAGWGKTTLLSHWAHDPEEQRNVAWVSLDEADDEPVRFWTYVLTALGSHGIGGRALAALGANGLDPVDLAVPLLLNELESMPAGTALVLDDYHLLRDPQLHESVEFLLAYLPPSLRLVIAGRADPPLPLARLRARGELTEIRVSDLTFSVAEAGEMLAAVGATTLDELSVTRLHERTEGWAVGLQLTALTLRGAARPTMTAATITGDDGHILDYFADEVICRLRPEQRDLLVRTSVLERLSGPTRYWSGMGQRRFWPNWTGPICSLHRSTLNSSGTGAINSSAMRCAPRSLQRRRLKCWSGQPTGTGHRARSRRRSATGSRLATTRRQPSC